MNEMKFKPGCYTLTIYVKDKSTLYFSCKPILICRNEMKNLRRINCIQTLELFITLALCFGLTAPEVTDLYFIPDIFCPSK